LAKSRPVGLGVRVTAIAYLAILVLLPIASLGSVALEQGLGAFWHQATKDQALASLWLTLWISLLATGINTFFGLWIAWTFARRQFWGKKVLDAIIDVPLALPAIVAGLMILLLYGPSSVVGVLLERQGIEILFARPGILLALLFVTLPLVVRALQPVIAELDPDVEAAAYTLGAPRFWTFLRVTMPALGPALATGAGLALARSLGEFGSLVLIAGNVPFQSEIAPVYVYSRIEMGQRQAAAAVATMLLLLAIVLLLILEFAQRRLTLRLEGQRPVREAK
jgi:sulfate transport system permease protein